MMKLVSPQLGMNIIKKGVEFELGFKIHSYKIVLDKVNNELYFLIRSMEDPETEKKHPYNDAHNIMTMLESSVKEKLPPNQTLDWYTVEHTPEHIKVFAGYTDNGKKQKTEFLI